MCENKIADRWEAEKFTGFPGPEVVHSCQASKKQLSGVHRYREAGELQLVAKRVGMRWNRAAGADGQPGIRGVCELSHKQWLGAQVCRGGVCGNTRAQAG